MRLATMLSIVMAFGLVLLSACAYHPPRVETSGSGAASGTGTPPQATTATTATTAKEALAKALGEVGVKDGWSIGGSADASDATIIGIRIEGAPKATPYMTLDEAVSAKTVEVKEREGGDVNTLELRNTGDKHVLLVAGDLLLGGMQDRIVAETMVVDPGTSTVAVPVFCVEHGRWHGQDKDGARAVTLTFSNSAIAGQANNSVKAAALGANSQSEVWQKVAETRAGMDIERADLTGTLRATVEDSKTAKAVEEGMAVVAKAIGDDVCGFAMVVKGEVVALDLYDSTGLCAKLRQKLVRGYLTSVVAKEYAKASPAGDVAVQRIFGADGHTNDSQSVQHATATRERPAVNLSSTATAGAVETLGVGASDVAVRDTATAATTRPTASTENIRQMADSTVRFTSKDTARGSVVHRCILRR